MDASGCGRARLSRSFSYLWDGAWGGRGLSARVDDRPRYQGTALCSESAGQLPCLTGSLAQQAPFPSGRPLFPSAHRIILSTRSVCTCCLGFVWGRPRPRECGGSAGTCHRVGAANLWETGKRGLWHSLQAWQACGCASNPPASWMPRRLDFVV
jgi:hypothetical protein